MTRRQNRWWLALGTAAISAGLGTAINIATNAGTNTWAWLGVVVLTLAAALAAIASGSLSGRRSSTNAASTAAANTAIAQNQSGNSGPALQAAGNINITHNTSRAIALVSVFVWIATVSGLVIGAKTNSNENNTSANPVDAFPPNASLRLYNVRSVYYYPKDGNLPTAPPPIYQYDDPNKRASECSYWRSYLTDVGAAPTIPDQELTTITGATSPVTILDMRVEVYAVRQIMSNKRVQCQYGAGGYAGATAFVDLDHPVRAIPLDIDGDSKPDTTLPGGRFVVDPKNAETLHITVDGSKKGNVYEYGLRLRVVENGRERTVTFGDKNRPLRAAFESDDRGYKQQSPDNPNDNVDWDYLRRQWVPAQEPSFR